MSATAHPATLHALNDRVDAAAAIYEHGACRDFPLEVFFPPPTPGGRTPKTGRPDPYAQARRICAACPVTDICLDFAITGNETAGCWAGHDPDQLATERARRRREDR